MIMENEDRIMFLGTPPFYAIWGDGSILKRYPVDFHGKTDTSNIAGLSIFSGLMDNSNQFISGKFIGKSVYELYKESPELFGNKEERRWEIVPIQIGVGHACSDLSIQVHPRENYALKHEGCHGKSECWYIVDVDEEPMDVVLGHKAKTMEELEDYIARDAYDDLALRTPIHKGTFLNLEAGTLHSLQKGTTFIEVCTSCLLTYRFYDYHRKDKNGKERQLDIEKAKANILIPYEEMTYDFKEYNYGFAKEKELTDNHNFSVRIIDVVGESVVPKKKPFYACFVIEGEGEVENYKVKAGSSFLLTSKISEMHVNGKIKILAAHG